MAPTAGHSKPFAHASLILIGLAWTLPFLQSRHGYPLTAFYSEWLAFGLGLAAALLLFARQAWREAELPAVALLPPALALLLGAQTVLGLVPYPEQAVIAILYLLWASLLMLLARVLVRELGMATVAATLAWFLLAGGLLNALAGYVQGHGIPWELDFLVTRRVGARVYGNLAQPNQYATHLVMALCSAAYLYGSGRIRVWAAIASAAWLLPALALSGSRSPWFYFVLIVVLAWALRRARGDEASRVFAYSLGLLPGFVVAGFVVAQWGGPAAGEPVTSTQRLFEAAAGLAPRIELAAEAWQMLLSAPALGAGWGQFAWHHFLHVAATGVTAAPGVYNNAHNIVLHLMAETGAVGGLLITGAAVLWIADLRRIRLDLEWWWVLALLAVLGAHSMVEYPLWYSYFLGMAAVLLGLGASRNFRLKLPGFAQLTAAVLMFAGWFNLVSVISHYRDFERLLFSPQARHELPVNEAAFEKSIKDAYGEPFLVPYVELAVAYAATVDRDRLRQKLELVDRAMHFGPTSVVVYRYAWLLAIAGRQQDALRQLEWAMRAYPEEVDGAVAELAGLSRTNSGPFNSLLELAKNKSAELHGGEQPH